MALVSILVNAYNSERYLKECLDSVYAQTFSDWEVIFIDNCSNDRTKEIAQSYDQRIVYYKTKKNIPLGEARSYGLSKCKGKFVCFLDSDDVWFSEKLDVQLALHERKPELKMSYAGGEIIDSEGNRIKDFYPKAHKDAFEGLLYKYDINMQSVMIRNEGELTFNTDRKFAPDFDLFMKLASKSRVEAIPSKLVQYRIHGDSLTSKTKALWSIEFRGTLNDILREFPELREKYCLGFKRAFAKADYYEARFLKEEQNMTFKPFGILLANSFIDIRYFILSIICLLPSFFWKSLHKY